MDVVMSDDVDHSTDRLIDPDKSKVIVSRNVIIAKNSEIKKSMSQMQELVDSVGDRDQKVEENGNLSENEDLNQTSTTDDK
ncbi:hypothetical protein WA026_014169 [Henosepilachna vigintioctopunctata]|uniref:Uncharacterized protein n=1 Tax=Henosepilachna vigintioctopunctata TaxID=420089 RepID=A0AAW1TTR7_9CUCU